MINKKDKESLSLLFKKIFRSTPQIHSLTGGGSSRRYYRLYVEDISVIGVSGDDIDENECFLRLDENLKKAGIKVPDIIGKSDNGQYYLLQDLGDSTLFKILKTEDKLKLSKDALTELVKIQTLPESIWKDSVGYKPFSKRLVNWDLNYFKYDFLKPAGILFNEELLEDDFEKLSNDLTSQDIITGFMYRDFQSRNIMVNDSGLWFIDFQGARKGPLAYDAASFIWQAKAPFTFQEREELEKYYVKILSSSLGIEKNLIERQLELMEIFRTLQVLGAYGFRGLIERKSHFLESLPFAISNLKYLGEKGRLNRYPEIKRISNNLSSQKYMVKKNESDGLTLSVFSFSYKKGYPEDLTGNGGGFMFDCRAIHNPGRYEEYKNLTGMDREVEEFLKKTNESSDFIDNCLALVRSSIERYLQRGFTSLQVGFGCTGGQHRSVYCAERFAKTISETFPDVKVKLIHREWNIAKEYN